MDIGYYKKYEPIDGKWYILNEIGKGAFGTVFEVERRDFTRAKSALKIITVPSSPSEVQRFREENYDLDEKSITSYFYGFVEEFIDEFRLMTGLRGNSNIVSIEDYDVVAHTDEIGWDIFIRMELLTPLNRYFRDNPLSKNTVIRLGIDICKALEVCSQRKIIHRDIKPNNIFVSDSGDFKLGDFGVARTLEKTSSGLSKKGTYIYMAPEVFKGEAYGASVDIYSLGIVMYKLLNYNMEPFRKERTHSDEENSLYRRFNGETLPSPALADDELSAIILKACSYAPKDRYQSPREMREDLEGLIYKKRTEYDGGKKIVTIPDANDVNNFFVRAGDISSISSNYPIGEDTDITNSVTVELLKNDDLNSDTNPSGNSGTKKTIGVFDETNFGKTINNKFEVIRLCMAHPPYNFESSSGKYEVRSAFSKIMPLYTGTSKVSELVVTSDEEEVKRRIKSTDTDSLMVMVKAMEYYMSRGESRPILKPLQEYIINILKTRPLPNIDTSKTETIKKTGQDTGGKLRINLESRSIDRNEIKSAASRKRKHKRIIIAVISTILIAALITGLVLVRVYGSPLNSVYNTEYIPAVRTADTEVQVM